ncbi:bifunctional alpha/beta hydrolase/OsmC family protein [Algoriphagus limi]|uniref:Alpha/beta fold hydrolase n=1 Tax=Algoriphagus limi TaxID=2975273 RepID=A0ABT2G3A0_9BACT|nr:bifunctional alpha/beta hydrolase/OsmC family protein [Algoriphagus limi]MCS5489740.1 alpha/beta fold hydrolase [Algoriphagus limi]
MDPREIIFKNRKGINLKGYLYHPLDSQPLFFAVFAHCFTCSKNFSAISLISKALSNEGIAVLSFDFTGLRSQKESDSNLEFSSSISDLIDASTFLEEHYEAPRLLLGHSLGGTAVLHAAATIPSVSALVTIGAPADPDHVKALSINSEVENFPKGKTPVSIGGKPFFVGDDFVKDLKKEPLKALLKGLKKSILILHSPQDEVVEIENAQKIYKAAFYPKSFVSLDGADHLISKDTDSIYIGQLVASWSTRYVPVSPKKENETKGHPVMVRLSAGDGYTTEIKTPHHHLIGDEPIAVGGKNLGPTPYDFLMASLGSCTAMTLKMYSERKKWPLKEVTVYLNHERVHREDSEHSEKSESKVSQFTRRISLEGDLDSDQRQRLLEIANRCPVHRTLEEDILIKTELMS